MFDPQAFMQATMEEALDTKRPLIPVAEYPGLIKKLEPKTGVIAKGDRTGETWGGLKVTYEITLDDATAQMFGRPTGLVSDMVMLDLLPNGMLDMGKGKNVQLGKLREAVGLNQAGVPFSPMMLEGRYLTVSVGHRMDKDDSSKIYEEVKGVRAS